MPNRLILEQSQYLLQHANNPVDWYPWGDEPFEIARKENKPVLVSIGYAACHWCHVMEHESFENADIANYMNEHFVCIKVDREEHPDVDHMYMDAIQAISGSGGWPLNVFVTPNRLPFYGGTYFPPVRAYNRPSWRQLLERMVEIWYEQADQVVHQADQLKAHLENASKSLSVAAGGGLTKADIEQTFASLMTQADLEHGGFGSAPKFPGSMTLSFLLDYYYYTRNTHALNHVTKSLYDMGQGGIYDQVGGGFARYSTDRQWLAPHFEKMLYDNALLIRLYAEAYAVTGDEFLKRIALECIEFVERELKEPTGGYFCSLDADSEGVEGKFYTWSYEDILEIGGEHRDFLIQYFGIEPEGNWEHTNILHVAPRYQNAVLSDEQELILQSFKGRLFEIRKQRIRPLLDDKCILAWNALYNIALSKAGNHFSDAGLVERAEEHLNWMLDAFEAQNGFFHTKSGNVVKIPAKLDDYAYLVNALIQNSSATGNNIFINRALNILEFIIAQFSGESNYFYYSPQFMNDIPVRKTELHDGALPSSNAVMAENLWLLGRITENSVWISQAEQMIFGVMKSAVRNPYSYGYWCRLMQKKVRGERNIVVSGSDSAKALGELNKMHIPNMFCLKTPSEEILKAIFKNKFCSGNLSIFVCTETECLPPESDTGKVLQAIRNHN